MDERGSSGNPVDADVMLGGFFDHGGFGDAFCGPEDDVGASAVACDFCLGAQVFVDGFEERCAMRGVAAADAAQMAFVHSCGDELRESFLFERGGVAVSRATWPR